MMPALNSVHLLGNVVARPELRYTPQGSPVAEFRIAINEKSKDKATTTFVDITAWGKTAEACEQYLDKGAPVFIDGRLKQDTWEDRETGKKRSKLSVTAQNVQFLGGRRSESAERPKREEQRDEPPPHDGDDVAF